MANFDNNVTINVTGNAPAVPSRSFSTILLIAAATTLGAGFTERYREYSTAAGVAADLAAGDISAATAARLNAWLSQTVRVGKVMVGRADIEAQVVTITVTIAADGAWVVPVTLPSGSIINGNYTASGSATASAIAGGLRSDLTTDLAGTGIAVSGSGAEIILTGTAGDDAFSADVTEAAGGASTVVTTNAAVTLKSELDAILTDTKAFYAAYHETSNHALGERLAQWCATNKRLPLIQTADSVAPTSGTTDIAYVRKAALDDRSVIVYHETAGNTEVPAFLVACKKLAANPDRKSTAWAYSQLAGVTAQDLSDTAKGHLVTKNCNVYGLFGNAGSFQPGKTPAGNWIDRRITFDWVEARAREAVQQFLIDASERNEKPGMDDPGLQSVASVIAAVLKQGEAAGHFAAGSTSVTVPVAADLTRAEKESGAVTIEARGEVRVGIYSVTANLTLVVDLASLSLSS